MSEFKEVSTTFEEFANATEENKRSRKDFVESCEDWQAGLRKRTKIHKCHGLKLRMECTDPECPMVIIGREVKNKAITFWRVDLRM